MSSGVSPIRLAVFYFVFFCAMGAMVPYWTLYLKDRGMSPSSIGLLVGLMTLTQVVAPNVWGAVADTKLGPARTIRWVLAVATVAFAGLFIPGGEWWVASVLLVYGFFWKGALPQFEALSLRSLTSGIGAYGRVRLWGSVGFIMAVLGCGWVLERTGPFAVPILVLPLLAATWFVCLGLRDQPAAPAEPVDSVPPRFAVTGSVVVFLAGCFLMQATHGPFYAFFSIHLDSLGYGRDSIGGLWALGVVAEIAAFAAMGRLVARFGLRGLFLFCFLAGALRWSIVAELSASVLWVAFSQLLHGVTFGIFHAASVRLVQNLFPESFQGRGQALYSSVGFGLGGGLGSALSGPAWDVFGAQATWLAAAGLSVFGFIFCLVGLSVNSHFEAQSGHRG